MNDYITKSQKLNHVQEQLRQYSGKKKEQGTYTFILCPYHAENTPSARVFHGPATYSPGSMKCMGCGAKASWNELAPKIGLKPFVALPPQDEFTGNKILPSVEELTSNGDLFVNEKKRTKALPPDKSWRGIPTNLLIALGAKRAKFYNKEYDSWSGERLFLPVLINGELAGYIKSRIEKPEDGPAHINATGPWSKTHGLFPYDFAIDMMVRIKSTTIVLVEGPRDALRLLNLGIPALCILGTQSYTDNKSKLMELAGVQRVVLMMDGDCAGIAATEFIKPMLHRMFDVEVVRLWNYKRSPYQQFVDQEEPSKAAKAAGVSLWDPGNMPEGLLLKLRAKYFSEDEL